MKRMGSGTGRGLGTSTVADANTKPWWQQFHKADFFSAFIILCGLYYSPKLTCAFLVVAWRSGWLNNPYKQYLAEAQEALTTCLNLVERADQKLFEGDDPTLEIRQLLVELQQQSAKGQLQKSSSLLNLSDLTASGHDSIEDSVLTSDCVKDALRQTGRSMKEAKKIFRGLAAKQSPRVMRFAAWVFKKLAAQLFPLGITPHTLELEKVKETAKKGHPMILLPTHKSHMDYLTVHHLCLNNGLQVPHVVAGDNLNMPLIGPILKAVGAMFIRRTFAGDVLYTAVFNEYMRQLLLRGHSLECFIEGGRSRSGKLLSPRIGFLRTIVENVLDDCVDDVYLIPISLSYDKIVESDSHIMELQGGTKQKEKLSGTLKSAFNLFSGATIKHAICYGRVDVGFGTPLSVRQLLEDRNLVSGSPKGSNSPQSRAKMCASGASLLAYRALYEMNQASTILPTALVGTLLVNHPDRALQMDALIERVRWLRRQVRSRHGRVLEERSVAESVQEVISRIMGSKGKTHLVKRHKGLLLTGIFTPHERMELSTYRNQLIHLFILEGFLACSLYKVMQDSNFTTTQCKRDDVLAACRFLSSLLKLEFIFRPSDNRNVNVSVLESNFDDTVKMWLGLGTLTPVEDQENVWNVDVVEHECATSPCLFTFVTSLFHPFIDSYYIMLLSLFSLLPNLVKPEGDIVNEAQMLGEKLFFETHLNFFESIAKETLQNALRVYIDMGVAEIAPIRGVNIKAVQLSEKYRVQQNLESLLDQVKAFRKMAPPDNDKSTADIITEVLHPSAHMELSVGTHSTSTKLAESSFAKKK